MAKATVNTNPSKKSVHILLDRSGSMGRNWSETIGAMNAYVTELAADETSKDTQVTLALFDAPMRAIDFCVLRRAEQASSWKPITVDEARPRGYTPLYDAIGKTVAMAEEDASDRTVLVVITDGAENASIEFSKSAAKASLDRCRERGWQVVFIGADFDAMAQSASVGGAVGQTMSMSVGNYESATRTLARKTRAYGNIAGSGAEAFAVAAATMSFDDDDRAEAVGKKAADKNPDEIGV